MHWTVLGSGTAAPAAARGSACHLLCGDGPAALFDAGSGAKDRLAASGVAFGALSHMVFTHAHLDHWSDLLSFLFYRMHAPAADRRAGLVVAGPPGFRDLCCDVAMRIDPDLIGRNQDIVWRDVIEGEPLEAGWFRAEPFRVAHGSQHALAYRVSGALQSLCYSGDSAPCEGLERAAQGVDWLVCECSFPDGYPTRNHMTPRAVRATAVRAGVHRVVLTHLYPEMAVGLGDAFDGFAGEVRVAHDGLVLPLGPGNPPPLNLGSPVKT
jgi:ribonuclease BN (tRNA processing enzyme)